MASAAGQHFTLERLTLPDTGGSTLRQEGRGQYKTLADERFGIITLVTASENLARLPSSALTAASPAARFPALRLAVTDEPEARFNQW